jgi:hypothetical protein
VLLTAALAAVTVLVTVAVSVPLHTRLGRRTTTVWPAG